ncbi:hypothetical protein LCGC14_1810100 [marine sediment metagenome]|uniref:Uncharacterized protein n=1 Tax=marine sediment metagenome TaxID=412755 RepID=A0A0F9JLR0_9ZZZZ
MLNGFYSQHWTDSDGNPAGGCSGGTGFTISWQNGPLGRDEKRTVPNGAFVEDVISATIDRIQFYQNSKFKSVFNARALTSLKAALNSLINKRTADREAREVEGTHEE